MDEIDEKIKKLSIRERQVAALLLEGCEDRVIGKELGIAKRTVKAHMHRMFTLFGIRTGYQRVKLAVLLYRKQLCDQPGHTFQSFGHPIKRN